MGGGGTTLRFSSWRIVGQVLKKQGLGCWPPMLSVVACKLQPHEPQVKAKALPALEPVRLAGVGAIHQHHEPEQLGVPTSCEMMMLSATSIGFHHHSCSLSWPTLADLLRHVIGPTEWGSRSPCVLAP